MPRTALHDRLFRALLRLFPAEFRGDFGAAMADDFSDQRDDAVQSGGPRSIVRLWLRTVADMLVRAPLEHVDILVRDAGYSLRLIRRRPGFAAGTLLTLVIGIGLNTAVFSVVHGVLWRELPYPESHRLVRLFEVKTPGGEPGGVSSANFLDWRAESKTLDGLALVNRTSATLIGTEDPEDIPGMLVSEDFFSILRRRPALGRVLEDRDFESLRIQVRDSSRREAPTPRAVVIADALWRRLFQTSPDIIGRVIRLDGIAVEVVGVMPPDFGFSPTVEREPAQFWLPFPANPVQRRARYLTAVGRLAPKARLTDAQAELDVIGVRLAAAYPADDTGWGIHVQPLRDTLIATVRTQLWILLGAVVCVLLIACVNVTNLLLAHASGRRRELAIRAALGASRSHLVRQTLTESLVLGVLGGIGGCALALWAVPSLVALAPANIPRLGEVAVDLTVLTFTAAISLGVSALTGVAACLAMDRVDPTGMLRAAGAAGSGGRRFRQGLTVVEVALALVLVIAASLLVRTMRVLGSVELGFDPAHVISIGLSPDLRAGRAAVVRLETEFVGHLLALPGVVAAGIGGRPLHGTMGMTVRRSLQDPQVQVGIDAASPGYVAALGATLVRGRFFSDSDTATSPRVAIVNQTAACRLWGDEDPVGASLLIDTRPAQIVGVIADVRRGGLEADPAPAVYLPNVQSMQISINNVLMRTDGDPREVLPAVRAIMRGLDRDQPLARIATLDDVIREATAPRRFNLQLVGLFAALALGLAILGIYGVISESIAQRIPEIGVRMALGAAPSGVVRMVLSHGGCLVGLGMILGVVGAYALKRAMASLIFGVPVTDPFAYGAGCACLLAVTLVACAVPAVRAARIDPVAALRNE